MTAPAELLRLVCTVLPLTFAQVLAEMGLVFPRSGDTVAENCCDSCDSTGCSAWPLFTAKNVVTVSAGGADVSPNTR